MFQVVWCAMVCWMLLGARANDFFMSVCVRGDRFVVEV